MTAAKLVRYCVFFSLCCMQPAMVRAGLFGEHKYMGDVAFKNYLEKHPEIRAMLTKDMQMAIFGEGIQYPADITNPDVLYTRYKGQVAIFKHVPRVGPEYGISYGDLTGLSGDHGKDVMDIEKGLVLVSSIYKPGYDNGITKMNKLQQLVLSRLEGHHKSISEGGKGASASGIADIRLASEDLSHFYIADLPDLREHLRRGLTEDLLDTIKKSQGKFYKLKGTMEKVYLDANAVSKYAILHGLALYLARQSGIQASRSDPSALPLMKAAILYNAFADHFLQDAFAAGHLPVVRNSDRSGDNNGQHDYFNRTGIEVRNKKGETWTTYGDDFYEEVTYTHAIAANEVSIGEMFDEFLKAKAKGIKAPLDVLTRITNKRKQPGHSALDQYYCDTLLDAFGAYDLIPLPVGPDFSNTHPFGNSRIGAYWGASIYGGAIAASATTAGPQNAMYGGTLKLGAGYNVVKLTDRSDKTHESKCWVGVNANAGYFMSKNVQLATAGIGVESVLWDKCYLAINSGPVWENGCRLGVRPALGYELKKVKRDYGLAFYTSVWLIPQNVPIYGIQFEYRRY